jgi:hypothetical protein
MLFIGICVIISCNIWKIITLQWNEILRTFYSLNVMHVLDFGNCYLWYDLCGFCFPIYFQLWLEDLNGTGIETPGQRIPSARTEKKSVRTHLKDFKLTVEWPCVYQVDPWMDRRIESLCGRHYRVYYDSLKKTVRWRFR